MISQYLALKVGTVGLDRPLTTDSMPDGKVFVIERWITKHPLLHVYFFHHGMMYPTQVQI